MLNVRYCISDRWTKTKNSKHIIKQLYTKNNQQKKRDMTHNSRNIYLLGDCQNPGSQRVKMTCSFFIRNVFIFSEFEPYSQSINLHDTLSIGFHVFRQDPHISHTKMNGNAETFDTSPFRGPVACLHRRGLWESWWVKWGWFQLQPTSWFLRKVERLKFAKNFGWDMAAWYWWISTVFWFGSLLLYQPYTKDIDSYNIPWTKYQICLL